MSSLRTLFELFCFSPLLSTALREMTMRFVRAYRYICLVSLAALTATEAQASRLYFSTVGPGGSPIANSTSLPTVPTVNLDLTSNPTGTLHIWMQVDVQPPAAGITINGLSYDIATSNPAVATPT